MTNQTINLSKGLEALYYLDPDYYDGQRGVIQDQSGYGRHASASGGPTIGVEGPNDFEATSFDGSDDRMDLNQTLDNSGEQTVAVLVDGDEGAIFGAKSSNDGWLLSAGFGKVIYNLRDEGGNDTKVQYDLSAPIGLRFFAGTYDGEVMKIYDDDANVADTTALSSHSVASVNAAVGATANGSDSTFDGKIIFAGKWSRTLSDSEIAYLNRLTAPRRAQI